MSRSDRLNSSLKHTAQLIAIDEFSDRDANPTVSPFDFRWYFRWYSSHIAVLSPLWAIYETFLVKHD